jgi:hypothetical protein
MLVVDSSLNSPWKEPPNTHSGSDYESLVEHNGCGPGLTAGGPPPGAQPAAGDSVSVFSTIGS